MLFRAQKRTRGDLATTARGLISETFPLGACTASLAVANQALRGTALGLRAGDLVTNIVAYVSVAASGTAGAVTVGLLDATYNKLVISGDVHASFAATGAAVCALTTPYTVLADGLYFPVLSMTTAFGTTQPSLVAGGATGVSGAISTNPRPAWLQGGQSSIPTTATPADTATAAWFGVS